jgi:hypothetical protein
MLFNPQCAVTKDPIYNGDSVVIMLLESSNIKTNTISHVNQNIGSINSHFIPSTLPIFGIYESGFVFSDNPASLECQLSSEVYGLNFTRAQVAESSSYEFINKYLVEAGFVTRNTLPFIIKASVYKIITMSHDSSAFRKRLAGDERNDILSSNFHLSFLASLRSRYLSSADFDVIVSAFNFFSGLRILGQYFSPELVECKMNFGLSVERIKFLNEIVFNSDVDSYPDNVNITWRCSISGMALAPGEIARVIPISDNMNLTEDTNVEDVLPHSVAGLYGVVSPSIKIIVGANGVFHLTEELSAFQRNALTVSSFKDSTFESGETRIIGEIFNDSYSPQIPDEVIIEDLLNGEISYSSGISKTTRNLSGMVISEKVYKYFTDGTNKDAIINSYYYWEELAWSTKLLVDSDYFMEKDVMAFVRDKKLNASLIESIQNKYSISNFNSKDEFNKYLVKLLRFEVLSGESKCWDFVKLFAMQYGGLAGCLSSSMYNSVKQLIQMENPHEFMKLLDDFGAIAHQMQSTINVVQAFSRHNIILKPTYFLNTKTSIKKGNIFNIKVRKSALIDNEHMLAAISNLNNIGRR